LLFSTYIGGSLSNEQPHSMVVNSRNQLLIMGSTKSTDFPLGTGIPYDNTQNGMSDIFVVKLSEDGKTLVANFGVDKSGVRRNKSTIADVLAVANAENDLDVGATTQLTQILGKNRELYLHKLKGLLSKLSNPEEMIQYTIQEGDKTFIRKQRTKDFLKEDASAVLPLINQIGVKIDE
jgi:hypothetical protein